MRILVLIAIGLLLYVIIGNLFRKNKSLSSEKPVAQKMVKCAHCGLHIPHHEALQKGGDYFCSQQHLDDFSK